MGKTKFDLIAASKRKGYRIAIIVLAVVGIILLGIGFLLRGTVTATTTPNRLDVTFSGQTGARPYYTATIAVDTWLHVDCGVGDQALTDPIVFEYFDGANDLFEPIAKAHRAGMFYLRLKDTAVDGQTGTVRIRCGSQVAWIEFTYADPTPAVD